MEDIDMSRSGHELFPELDQQTQGVTQDQVAEDPLNTGVHQQEAAAQTSDKEINFRAMRDEISKAIQEREYWKGQAEALNRPRQEPVKEEPNPFSEIYDDNLKGAFEALRSENKKLRYEFQDQMAAISAKSQYSDWNNMVTQHVPELTAKNPIFAEMIQKASNPYEAAYLLAQLNSKSSAPERPPQQGNGQRAIQNAQKPQSVATIGGHGTLSSVDYYSNMSDDDFMKVAARNLANI